MNDEAHTESHSEAGSKGSRIRRVDVDVINYPIHHVSDSGA